MSCRERCLLPLFVDVVVMLSTINTQRLWRTLYMDSAESTAGGATECGTIRPIRNDDMAAGDYYVVKSDSWYGRPDPWQGRSRLAIRPAECTLAFNLGDRLVTATVDEWRCNTAFSDLFVALYDDCDGQRKRPLAVLNCTVAEPPAGTAAAAAPSAGNNDMIDSRRTASDVGRSINSPSHCLTLYHYRGHVRSGYYFSINVIAQREMMPFSAGAIAALILLTAVALMIIIKLICVCSGYDRQPTCDDILGEDEQKQMLGSIMSGSDVISSSWRLQGASSSDEFTEGSAVENETQLKSAATADDATVCYRGSQQQLRHCYVYSDDSPTTIQQYTKSPSQTAARYSSRSILYKGISYNDTRTTVIEQL